ncbi:MAG TPA: hypothetical protein VLA46_02850 [Saprospiraceae bacterium]|nr:hypothetical protein [Saprospiraceae bacterium]
MVPGKNMWVRIAVFNLAIVALLGAVMRYKIGFALPFLDQKFLQESHSHFAFTGWITHTLYFLLVNLFRSNLPSVNEKAYRLLIWLNLLTAYGMLVSFALQGYGPVSIVFASLSILIGYLFAWRALIDAGRLPDQHPGKNWIKASLWFSVLSTLGTMVLSWMMATRQYDQETYLASIYFYLHFQYNGWFLFACFGIFLDHIRHFPLKTWLVRYAFALFAIAAIPAYFLSTLWAHIPEWLYAAVIIASFLQIAGWYYFIKLIRENLSQLRASFSRLVLLLFLAVALALTLKLILQLGSTVPAISKLAYSFRPIVIAYLHLVLLLIISVFLLTFMYGSGLLRQNKPTRIALLLFAIGVILNETVLAVQGIWSFSYTVIPYANEALFGIAMLMLISLLFLVAFQLRPEKSD